MSSFWCVTPFFNPAGYRVRLENYHLFAERLAKQGVDLLTVELAFGDASFQLPASDRVMRLRGRSVLWQKERLINYAFTQLPPECAYVAWLDCDLLFQADHWPELVPRALQRYELVQLFGRVIDLPAGHRTHQGKEIRVKEGIAWQAQLYGDRWLPLRAARRLPHAAPGFAWACRRGLFASSDGIYDRLITGSGDAFLVDCCLNSFRLHHYFTCLTEAMWTDMAEWKDRFLAGRTISLGYLPIDLYHLWHGSRENRAYDSVKRVYRQYEFDPGADVALVNHAYEWSSDKPGLHRALVDHFSGRNEDQGGHGHVPGSPGPS